MPVFQVSTALPIVPLNLGGRPIFGRRGGATAAAAAACAFCCMCANCCCCCTACCCSCCCTAAYCCCSRASAAYASAGAVAVEEDAEADIEGWREWDGDDCGEAAGCNGFMRLS